MNGVCNLRLYRHSLSKERRKRKIKRRRLWVAAPVFLPKLSQIRIVEKKNVVKPPFMEEAAVAEHTSACMEPCRLQRHGGLIRKQRNTIRVSKGKYRCPCCRTALSACSTGPQQMSLPLWHHDVEHYLNLVGTHGLPEEDRPRQCPKCRQGEHMPHRHSHYERLVITISHSVKICIFRFRCPDCGYVHSVIPTFLEPYMQMTLDVQEELVEVVEQGVTVEEAAEMTQSLPSGGFDEQTIGRLVRAWNERLAQLQSGLWAWMLARVPHVTLPRSSSLWNTLRSAWQAVRERIPAFREIRFLHGLNRLHFSMTVTAHG